MLGRYRYRDAEFLEQSADALRCRSLIKGVRGNQSPVLDDVNPGERFQSGKGRNDARLKRVAVCVCLNVPVDHRYQCPSPEGILPFLPANTVEVTCGFRMRLWERELPAGP